MGANCSISSNDKYNSAKKHIEDVKCMKLHAIDGLLSETKQNPVILMGEHHSENEGNGIGECLNVLDIVSKVTSPNECDENSTMVYFLYENPVISNNTMFLKEDHNSPFFEGQESLTNIHGTRFHVITQSGNYKNIKSIPIDVFGRMRSFNFHGEQRNPIHTQEVAINEIGEFWKSVGYPLNFIEFIAPKAIQIAQDMTNVFFNTLPDSGMTYEEILEVFTCVSLAKLSLFVNEDDVNSSKGKDYVMAHCDQFIEILMSMEPEKNKNSPLVEISDDIESSRSRIRMLVAFELISISGDMVAYEYISSLKRNSSNILTIVHAGFNHTNRLRNWLNFSEYKQDLERVSQLALDDVTFNASRKPIELPGQ